MYTHISIIVLGFWGFGVLGFWGGFIIPIWLSILSGPTLLNKSSYVAIIRLDKSSANFDTVDLLLSPSMVIVEISSSGILIFGVSRSIICSGTITFEMICPNFNKKFTEFIKLETKTNLCISSMNDYKDDTEIGKFPEESYNEKVLQGNLQSANEFIDANCYIESITLNSKLIGYSVKFTIIKNKSASSIQLIPNNSPFEFWYDEVISSYIRECDPEVSKLHLKENMAIIRKSPDRKSVV